MTVTLLDKERCMMDEYLLPAVGATLIFKALRWHRRHGSPESSSAKQVSTKPMPPTRKARDRNSFPEIR